MDAAAEAVGEASAVAAVVAAVAAAAVVAAEDPTGSRMSTVHLFLLHCFLCVW